jgi:phage shock protein C
MHCYRCGKRLKPYHRSCPVCGRSITAAERATEPSMQRPLTNRFFGGVCAAFALHYGLKVNRVRLATLLFIVCTGIGGIAYLAAWLVIPGESYPTKTKSA